MRAYKEAHMFNTKTFAKIVYSGKFYHNPLLQRRKLEVTKLNTITFYVLYCI